MFYRTSKFLSSVIVTLLILSLITGCSSKEEISGNITSFDDIRTDKVSLIALGNNDVPVGQYSEELFTSLGFWDEIQPKISYGTNVKEVLSQVATASVDCGVVYATDAATDDTVTVVCKAPDDSIKTPIIYPGAVLSDTQNDYAAEVFLQYLLTDGAKKEFKKAGFDFYATAKNSTDVVTSKCTLTIFAAASLTESLTAIAEEFKKTNPDVDLIFNFDSSGTLKTQIEAGAPADIFISAAQKQMDELDNEGYIADDTRIDLLKNEVVLIVPSEKK